MLILVGTILVLKACCRQGTEDLDGYVESLHPGRETVRGQKAALSFHHQFTIRFSTLATISGIVLLLRQGHWYKDKQNLDHNVKALA